MHTVTTKPLPLEVGVSQKFIVLIDGHKIGIIEKLARDRFTNWYWKSITGTTYGEKGSKKEAIAALVALWTGYD